MAKVGRKPWIPDLARVEELAAQGLTVEQVAHCLGVTATTIYDKQSKFTEFSETIRRGRAKGIQQVANVVFQAALKGNIQAAMFFLKARAGWRDTAPADMPSYTREELIEMIEHEISTMAEQRALQGRLPALAARMHDANFGEVVDVDGDFYGDTFRR